MSTITETTPSTPAPPSPSSTDAETRLVLRGVGWRGLKLARALVGDRPVRITCFAGDLELMSPSYLHEAYGRTLDRIIPIVTSAFGLPCKVLGSTTYARKKVDSAKEADAAFYLQNAPRVIGRRVDPKTDPVPDLVIEVAISHSATLAPRAYAAMGVPEVWHCRENSLRFLQLIGDSYVERPTSPALPMLGSAEVFEWVMKAVPIDDSEWFRLFTAWVRDELVHRHRGGA